MGLCTSFVVRRSFPDTPSVLVRPSPPYIRMDAQTPGRPDARRRTIGELPTPRRPGAGKSSVLTFSRSLVLSCYRATARRLFAQHNHDRDQHLSALDS